MSTVVLDTITGKSTATTITIGSTPVVSASANSMTIRGEGSAQTSIQQGLAKSWVNNTDAAAITDSFNIASGTDNSTGNYDLTFTNPMANATYSPSVCTLFAQLASIGQEGGDITTTFYQVQCFKRTDSLTVDDERAFSQIFGDLA